MKIGIDIRPVFDSPAGIGRYAKNMVSCLLSEDSKNEFVLFGNKASIGDAFPGARLIKINHEFYLWHFLAAQYIKRERIDLYISFVSIIVPLISKVKSIIMVPDLTPISMPDSHHIKSVVAYRFFLGKALRKAEKIITISQNSRRDILARFSIPEEKVHVLYPGVSPIQNKDQAPGLFHVNGHKVHGPYLLYVGTVEPRKDLGALIKAFAGLKREGIFHGSLLIAGKLGWKYEALFELPEYSEFKDSIHFLGYVSEEELSKLYGRAEIFVYPSLYEGFGLPILEAMQFELPVVTCASSSLEEAGGDGVLYFPPGDTEELRRQLKKLLLDPALRKDLIQRGKKQLTKFQYAYSAKEFQKLIMECG
jgi:glycosyltransferase involved in cell wall biosynthesis